MAINQSEAVKSGAMAAGRLLRELGIQSDNFGAGGSIDVFGAIAKLDIPVLVRPLEGLLGAYINTPTPGILVTSERRLSIQRFTAAHELGHFFMQHHLSLDDEQTILKRAPGSADASFGFQETEANAFAVAFMMPKWLITSLCLKRGWLATELQKPEVVYQLSLRLGASYEATCRTLNAYKLISYAALEILLGTSPRNLKIALLGQYHPKDYKGDVWLLTEHDRETKLSGCENDIFIIKLHENATTGYVWEFNDLAKSDFTIVADRREAIDDSVGSPGVRSVTAVPSHGVFGELKGQEVRPWVPDKPKDTYAINYDLTGPEPEGLPRFERLKILEAI